MVLKILPGNPLALKILGTSAKDTPQALADSKEFSAWMV